MRYWTEIAALFIVVASLASCNEWRETFEKDSDVPYALSVLPAVIQAAYNDASYSELDLRDLKNGELNQYDSTTLYIAASAALLYTNKESEALAQFIERGGTAFIVAKDVSNKLLAPYAVDSCAYLSEHAEIKYGGNHTAWRTARGDSLTLSMIGQNDYSVPNINGILWDANCFPSARDILISTHPSHHATKGLVKFAHGSGNLYWLSLPITLTNVYTTDSLGQIFINELLSYLPQSPKQVIYDINREATQLEVSRDNNLDKNSSSDATLTTLAEVLKRPPLAAAWYLLLAGCITFIVLGAKRPQRQVPLAHSKKNTTHAHLANVARLYLAKPDNVRMANKQLKLFEAYCNRRFNLRPLHEAIDSDALRKVPGVATTNLDVILRYHRTAQREQNISNAGFVQFVRALQNFYRSIGR